MFFTILKCTIGILRPKKVILGFKFILEINYLILLRKCVCIQKSICIKYGYFTLLLICQKNLITCILGWRRQMLKEKKNNHSYLYLFNLPYIQAREGRQVVLLDSSSCAWAVACRVWPVHRWANLVLETLKDMTQCSS